MAYKATKVPTNIGNSTLTREYTGFRGVDFSSDVSQVALSRSPYSVNMWRNYRSSLGSAVETRMGHRVLRSISGVGYVLALHFFNYEGYEVQLVHIGTQLYRMTASTPVQIDGVTLSAVKSTSFIYGDKIYINDGTHFVILKLAIASNDVTVTVGTEDDYYIPTTYIILGDGTASEYQQFNIMTGRQKNELSGITGNQSISSITLRPFFINSDGTPKAITIRSVTKNGTALAQGTGYTFGTSTVTLSTAAVAGDTVVVEFSQALEEANPIARCRVSRVFDNRAFYTGDSLHPNRYYWSNLDKPYSVGYMDYEDAGTENTEVKALIPISSQLALIKGASGQESSVYIISEVLNSEDNIQAKTYPNKPIICGYGCLGAAYNFLNDAVFLTKYGVKAIGTMDLHNERAIEHRSSLVDGKLTNEDLQELQAACFEEFRGYLMLLVNGRIYLADSRATYSSGTNIEYEWFLWDNIGIWAKTGGTADANNVLTGAVDRLCKATCLKEFNDKLYFGTTNGYICMFNTDMLKDFSNDLNVDSFGVGELTSSAYEDERVGYNAYNADGTTVSEVKHIAINSCWTTPSDDFGYRNRFKTTNKRGALADLKSFAHSICKVRIKTSRDAWRDIVRHNGGYFDFSDLDFADFTFNTSPTNVLRFKPKFKKWERISIMFYSDEIRKPFGITSARLEAFIGGYAKE